jgi:hypothetical protein
MAFVRDPGEPLPLEDTTDATVNVAKAATDATGLAAAVPSYGDGSSIRASAASSALNTSPRTQAAVSV